MAIKVQNEEVMREKIRKLQARNVIQVVEAPDLFFFGYAAYAAQYSVSRRAALEHLKGKVLADEVIVRLSLCGSQPVGSILARAFFGYDHGVRMGLLRRVAWFDPFCNDYWATFLDETVTCEQLLEMARLRYCNFVVAYRVFVPEIMRAHPSIQHAMLQINCALTAFK